MKKKKMLLTFKVFGALPFFAGLADDFDRATGKGANDPLGLFAVNWRGDLHQCLYFFLLLIDIGDEELFSDAAANIRCTCWRIIYVKSLAG